MTQRNDAVIHYVTFHRRHPQCHVQSWQWSPAFSHCFLQMQDTHKELNCLRNSPKGNEISISFFENWKQSRRDFDITTIWQGDSSQVLPKLGTQAFSVSEEQEFSPETGQTLPSEELREPEHINHQDTDTMFCMKKNKNSRRSKGSVDRTQDSKLIPDKKQSLESSQPPSKDSASLKVENQPGSTHEPAASPSAQVSKPEHSVKKESPDTSTGDAQPVNGQGEECHTREGSVCRSGTVASSGSPQPMNGQGEECHTREGSTHGKGTEAGNVTTQPMNGPDEECPTREGSAHGSGTDASNWSTRAIVGQDEECPTREGSVFGSHTDASDRTTQPMNGRGEECHTREGTECERGTGTSNGSTQPMNSQGEKRHTRERSARTTYPDRSNQVAQPINGRGEELRCREWNSSLASLVAAVELSQCQTHPGKTPELYCVSHQLPICVLCASITHRSCHEIKTCDEVLQERSGELQAFSIALEEQERALARQRKKIEEKLRALQMTSNQSHLGSNPALHTQAPKPETPVNKEGPDSNSWGALPIKGQAEERHTRERNARACSPGLGEKRQTRKQSSPTRGPNTSSRVAPTMNSEAEERHTREQSAHSFSPGLGEERHTRRKISFASSPDTDSGVAVQKNGQEQTSSSGSVRPALTPTQLVRLQKNVFESKPYGPALARTLKVGDRVKRPCDWLSDEDRAGQGTVTAIPSSRIANLGEDPSGLVDVRWDSGGEGSYRMGRYDHYDLDLA